MKKLLCALAFVTSVSASALAWAQEGVSPAGGSPPARVGFQMGLRTGYAIPMGKATDAANDEMSNAFGGQVPLFIEIGGKVIPNLFIGGYLGLAFGGTAGDLKTICDNSGATCTSFGVRLGAEIQYHILPAGSANPWVGYGIGYEATGLSYSVGGQTGSGNLNGLELAHLMGGVDFRLSRIFGLGPVIDLSLGQYTHTHTESPGLATVDRDIDRKAMHEWLAFGVRGVFFP